MIPGSSLSILQTTNGRLMRGARFIILSGKFYCCSCCSPGAGSDVGVSAGSEAAGVVSAGVSDDSEELAGVSDVSAEDSEVSDADVSEVADVSEADVSAGSTV